MNLSIVKQAIKNNLPNRLIESIQYLKYVGKEIPDYDIYQSFLKNRKGIEIGGPSTLFKTMLPIYQVIESLDAVNFADNTVWEGSIPTGRTFNYIKDKKGFQFISEATNLDQINSSTYDFLLSSNCLEHIANPLEAIKEWKRIIKDGGFILLVLPNKENNFDHNRPVTTFEHLLDDYKNKITEHDLTHLDEILALHDLSMDPPAGNLEEFRLRSLDNFNNRTLHHHVFDIPLMTKILEYYELEVVKTSITKEDFIALGRKT
jgi:SAM-dependent methyltransferase